MRRRYVVAVSAEESCVAAAERHQQLADASFKRLVICGRYQIRLALLDERGPPAVVLIGVDYIDVPFGNQLFDAIEYFGAVG